MKRFTCYFLYVTGLISEEIFGPIARGLTQSASVCDFELVSERLDGEAARCFSEMLQTKRNLKALSITIRFFGENERQAVLQSITTALTRPGSLLHSLEYTQTESSEDDAQRDFLPFLQGVAMSNLKRFKIRLLSQEQFLSLVDIFPLLRLDEIEILVDADIPLADGAVTDAILGAAKRNLSLRSIKVTKSGNPDMLSQAEHQRRLTFYYTRNEGLGEWVENPGTIRDQKLWPLALSLAGKAHHPDHLFRGLMSAVGKDYFKKFETDAPEKAQKSKCTQD